MTPRPEKASVAVGVGHDLGQTCFQEPRKQGIFRRNMIVITIFGVKKEMFEKSMMVPTIGPFLS